MLALVGLNHRSASLAMRERMGFAESELPEALARLAGQDPVREALIVSTCNRVEILVRTGERHGGVTAVKSFLSRERGVSLEEIERYAYQHEGMDAARHVFRVAAGLDSMVLGEPQILGQVRNAYRAARSAGTTGPILDRLLQQGLATAKRVRTETGISRHAVSIAYAAVELARRIFGDLSGRSVLLLGAGKMTDLAATHLVGNGIAHVVVGNRTYSRAVELAEKFGGEAVNWDAALSYLGKADIVVTGTAAPEPVVTKEAVQQAVRVRRSRPLFLIDIAVPRDVDPGVNDLDNVYLYDIDDLRGVVDENLEERRREADLAARMIDQELETFGRWLVSLEVAPTIAALSETLHGVGRREIERFRRKLGKMTPEQDRAVRELTRAVIQKILHPTIRHLKECAERGGADDCAGRYRRIFGIPEGTTATGAGEGTAAPSEEPSAPDETEG